MILVSLIHIQELAVMALSEKAPVCKGDRPMHLLMNLCEYTHLKTFWTACFT